jgi:hypothetical protein
MDATTLQPKLIVTFRGKKLETELKQGLAVREIKARVVTVADPSLELTPDDIKLMYKGKILTDDNQDLHQMLIGETKKVKIIRIMATGVSSTEASTLHSKFQQGLERAPRIRNDLTPEGRMEIKRRQKLAQNLLLNKGRSSSPKYGFGRIETLPMLPDQDTARHILTSLANDPGVLACMAKHKWNVGSLAELYPEGKVGQSEVCVMGLNKNKGQQILLRVRTDDLKGFRKILSIKKVLYHELSHNVHSEHDDDFFQLMRQIERECNELDWTGGAGLTSMYDSDDKESSALYSGGSYRLGGSESSEINVPVRELAARAAMMRMTAEEEEIQQHCGCGKEFSTRQTEDMQADDSSNGIEKDESKSKQTS